MKSSAKAVFSSFVSLVLAVGLCPGLAFAQDERAGVDDFAAATWTDSTALAEDEVIEPEYLVTEPSLDEPAKAVGEAELNLIQSGDYRPESGLPVMSSQDAGSQGKLDSVQEAALRSRWKTCLENLQESFDVSDLAISADDATVKEVQQALSDETNSDPDFFYVSGGFSFEFGATIGIITPKYSYELSDIPAMREAYEQKLQEVLSWIPEGATQVQQAKAVHDWLVRNCNYNDDAFAAHSPDAYEGGASPWNAYGALVLGTPVCEGYSLAFLAAMNRIGIPCTYVTQFVQTASGEEGHGWNRVQLDGSWYNLDVTWDDNRTDAAFATIPDTTYFLKSDGWFKTTGADADGFHTSWEPAGVAGNNTQYDGRTQAEWPTYSAPAVVAPVQVTGFSLTQTSLRLSVDQSEKLDIDSVAPAAADPIQARARATWASSNTSVATVDRSGMVTAGSMPGSADVTCEIDGVSRTCKVTVDDGLVLDAGEVGGRTGTCKWVIDKAGNLTVSPLAGDEGTMAEWGNSFAFDGEAYLPVSGVPWADYSDRILTAKFTGVVHAPADCSFMFYMAENMKTADLTNLDTSSSWNINGLFGECHSLESANVSSLDTSNVTYAQNTFSNCYNLKSVDVSKWNTSNLVLANGMFTECRELRSADVSSWDTSNIVDMSMMFANNFERTSLDVSHFDTSNVTDMSMMFASCSKLPSLDVSHFNTSNVTDMSSMFSDCASLTSLDVTGLDTSKVESMKEMFMGCHVLETLDVTGFDTSNVTDFSSMFSYCNKLKALDVSKLNTAKAEKMDRMFCDCQNLTQLDVTRFRTSNVNDMTGMFSGCYKLAQIDVTHFNTSNVTSMGDMFYYCKSFKSLDLSGFDTSRVTDMHFMFFHCSSLASLDLSCFATAAVADMSGMFAQCSALKALDLSRLNTSNVTNMCEMLSGCTSLAALNISGVKTSNVTNMSKMFAGCASLTSLDLTGFDTSHVTNMSEMFGTSADLDPSAEWISMPLSVLTSLDLSSFDTSRVTDMTQMFSGCPCLSTITFGSGFRFLMVESAPTANLGDISVTDEYTGRWERTSDGALASSFDLMKRTDLKGTWTWQRKPGSGQGGNGGNANGQGGSGQKADLATYTGEAKKAGFTDLDASAWYLNDGGRFPDSQTLYLDYTIKRGLMSGYTGARKGQFGPDDDLSRGMAATIIYRMATGKTAETTDNNVDTPFSDVPRGAWYAAAVKWCAEEGVVTGYAGTTKFGPDDPITREQLATVIGRYMDPKAEAGDDVSQFKDAAAISAFAKGGIAYCNAKGIMTGIGDSGNFQPGGKASRCQMAKVIAVTDLLRG